MRHTTGRAALQLVGGRRNNRGRQESADLIKAPRRRSQFAAADSARGTFVSECASDGYRVAARLVQHRPQTSEIDITFAESASPQMAARRRSGSPRSLKTLVACAEIVVARDKGSASRRRQGRPGARRERRLPNPRKRCRQEASQSELPQRIIVDIGRRLLARHDVAGGDHANQDGDLDAEHGAKQRLDIARARRRRDGEP